MAFALFSFVVPCRQFLARRDEGIALAFARLRWSIGHFNLPPFEVACRTTVPPRADLIMRHNAPRHAQGERSLGRQDYPGIKV